MELGCGTGSLSLELARRHPDRNVIGVDNKRARIWAGARRAIEEQLNNVAFISARVESLHNFFAPGEVSEVWIPFPDPYPKPSKSGKRLVSPRMLNLYRMFVEKECIFQFKTDDDQLFRYALRVLEEENCEILMESRDIHSDRNIPSDALIVTDFERRHLAAGRTIKYLKFRLSWKY